MGLEDLIEAARLTPLAAPFDWGRAESVLRTPLPADYRGLVDAGGGGLWFDYLRVFAPDDRDPSRNLLDADAVFADLELFWEDDPDTRPADLPEGARLIAWASTGSGETLFWRVDPGTPADAYPVYVENADGDGWERFDMGTADFLLGLLRGGVRCKSFSEVFFDRAKVFRPFTR